MAYVAMIATEKFVPAWRSCADPVRYFRISRGSRSAISVAVCADAGMKLSYYIQKLQEGKLKTVGLFYAVWRIGSCTNPCERELKPPAHRVLVLYLGQP